MENIDTKTDEDEYNKRNTQSKHRYIFFVVLGSILITAKIIILVYVCIRHYKHAAEAKKNEMEQKSTTNENNIEKVDNLENNILHKNTKTGIEKIEEYSEEEKDDIKQKDIELLSLEHVNETKIIEMLNKNTNGLKLSNITFHKEAQEFLGQKHKDNDFVHFNPCIDITLTSMKVVHRFLLLFGIHKNIWTKFVNERKEELRIQELFKTPTQNTFATNFPGPNKVPPSILKRKGWTTPGKKKKLKFEDD